MFQARENPPLFVARTLDATGQSRVTLSLRQEHLRAASGPRQEAKAPEIRRKRGFFPQAAQALRGDGVEHGRAARAAQDEAAVRAAAARPRRAAGACICMDRC